MNATKNTKMKMKTLAMAAVLVSSPVFEAMAQTKKSVKEMALQGMVKASRPISNAMIRVLDSRGNVLSMENASTDKNGYFKVRLRTDAVQPETKLIVESSGGAKGSEKFDGHLYGNVSLKDSEELVHLNAATTLSHHYQDLRPGLTTKQADKQVQKFLNVPEVVDLGFGIENPKLKLFSANELERQAATNGGFDQYTQKLAGEMNANSQAKHPLVAPKMLKAEPASWLAEELLSAAVGEGASSLFSGLLEGMGFPSSETTIEAKLDLVLARIAEIQQSLQNIEIDIKQSAYDQRAGALWQSYKRYVLIINQMKALDIKAKGNLDESGKVKDEELKRQIQVAATRLQNETIEGNMDLVVNVHSELEKNNPLGVTPLQQVFAHLEFLKSRVITKDYFAKVYDQVEQYKSLQSVVATLFHQALSVESKVDADIAAAEAKKMMDSEVFIYPTPKFFSSNDMKEVIAGNAIYDLDTNQTWSTDLMAFNTCDELHENSGKNVGKYHVPGWDEIATLLNHTGNNGKNFAEKAANIGIKLSDANVNPGQSAETVKMIAFGCDGKNDYSNPMINWFGDDRTGPWDEYYDAYNTFSSIAGGKGMSKRGRAVRTDSTGVPVEQDVHQLFTLKVKTMD